MSNVRCIHDQNGKLEDPDWQHEVNDINRRRQQQRRLNNYRQGTQKICNALGYRRRRCDTDLPCTNGHLEQSMEHRDQKYLLRKTLPRSYQVDMRPHEIFDDTHPHKYATRHQSPKLPSSTRQHSFFGRCTLQRCSFCAFRTEWKHTHTTSDKPNMKSERGRPRTEELSKQPPEQRASQPTA